MIEREQFKAATIRLSTLKDALEDQSVLLDRLKRRDETRSRDLKRMLTLERDLAFTKGQLKKAEAKSLRKKIYSLRKEREGLKEDFGAFVDGKKNHLNPTGLSLQKVIMHLDVDHQRRKENKIPIHEIRCIMESLDNPVKIVTPTSPKEMIDKDKAVNDAER